MELELFFVTFLEFSFLSHSFSMSLWNSQTGNNFQPELSLNPSITFTEFDFTPSFQTFPIGKKANREREKFYTISEDKTLKKVISSQKDYYFKMKQKVSKDLQSITKAKQEAENEQKRVQNLKETLQKKSDSFYTLHNQYLKDNTVTLPEPNNKTIEEEETLFSCYRESLKNLSQMIEQDKRTMLLERAQLIEERKRVEGERISFRNDFQRVKAERMILEKELVRIQGILQESKKEYDEYQLETSKNDKLNEELSQEMSSHEQRKEEVTNEVNRVNIETRKNNTARDNLIRTQDQLNDAIHQFDLKKTAYQASADQVSEIGRKMKNEQKKLLDEKLQLRAEYEALIQQQESLLPAKELFLLQCTKIQDARKNLALLSQTLAEEEANLAYEESLIEEALNQSTEKTQLQMLQMQKQKLIKDITEIQKKLVVIREEHELLAEKVAIKKEQEEKEERLKHAAERTK